MKKSSLFFNMPLLALLCVLGGISCEKREESKVTPTPTVTPLREETKPAETISKPALTDVFKSQTLEMLSLAGQLNARMSDGFTKIDPKQCEALLMELTSKFEIVNGLWPANQMLDAQSDLKNALRAWRSAITGIRYDGHTVSTQFSREEYEALVQMDSENAFDIRLQYGVKVDGKYKLEHFGESDREKCIFVGYDIGGTQIAKIITLGNKYFERGRGTLLKEINQ